MLNQAPQYLLTPYKSRAKLGLRRACNVFYGKTKEQLIEREWVSDVVSNPSESRGKPETSVETPRVEKELLSTIEVLQGKTLEPYIDHMGMLHRWFFMWGLQTPS